MLLSIVILSYNRPKQVERILEHFIGVQKGDFNIVVKDDSSPLQVEIAEIVESYSEKLQVEVIFHANEKNMGYDMNLLDSFVIAESEYVFLLSDDDYIDGHHIASALNVLARQEFNLYITPYHENGVTRRSITSSYNISKFADIIYNSILFSGLIFRKSAVLSLNLDLSFLSNCIYSQVYISAALAYQDQNFGVMPVGILYLGGDGENYFGKNSSAKNSELLSERKQIDSNLNYQKFLLEVVDEVSKNTTPLIKVIFLREYRRRLVGYGFRARSNGFRKYSRFIRSHLILNGFVHSTVLLFLIALVPAALAKQIYRLGTNLLKNSG